MVNRLWRMAGRTVRVFAGERLELTATPHNGKDEDFQLWLQLLDPDRFYGVKGEDGSRIRVDESIMRRMVKEQLLKFDGTRLFPPRKADTVKYCLSPT